jgi:hypothetical protein
MNPHEAQVRSIENEIRDLLEMLNILKTSAEALLSRTIDLRQDLLRKSAS